MRRLKLLLALGTASIALQARAAQSLDYNNLESLFEEPVTTSATGKPERVSDTAVTMDIMTADEIKRSGAHDLASLLRMLPGITSYRGANGTDNFAMGALLLNGREIFYASFDQNFLSATPVELDEIRQIEIVHGPLNALYGFNAANSVINIITYDPAQTAINQIQGRLGNNARRDGSVIATIPVLPWLGVRLTAADEHQHDVGEIPLLKTVPDLNPDRKNLAFNASAIFANGDHATAEASHTDVSQKAMVPQVETFIDFRVITDAAKIDYSADTVVGLASALLSYWNLTAPEAQTATTPVPLSLHDRVIDGRINDQIKLTPSDTIRVEFEARDEAVRASTAVASVRTRLYAESVQWEHDFLPGLTLVNGARYFSSSTQQGDPALPSSFYSFDNHALADNSALLYKVTPDDSLRASFSRGETPAAQLNFVQLGLVVPAGGKSSIANNPNIIGGKETEYRLTWDHQIDPLGAAARISLYDKLDSNIYSLLPMQFGAALSPACLRLTPVTARFCQLSAREAGIGGYAKGAQFEINHKSASGLAWGLNYTIEQDHPHPTANSATSVPALATDQIYGKAGANIGYGWDNWTADVRLLYTSSARNLVLVTQPTPQVMLYQDKATVLVSPHLSWNPGSGFTIDLAADNLWGYKNNIVERVPTSYYLTLKWAY